MDPRGNPFNPGAGTMPPALTGRSELSEDVDIMLDRLWEGRNAQAQIITGLHGVGKTVLLNKFRENAEERGWIVLDNEMDPAEPFAPMIARACRKALYSIDVPKRWKLRARSAAAVVKSFGLTFSESGATFHLNADVEAAEGRGDSGVLSDDLTDLILELGAAAQEKGTGVLFLFDEIQFIDKTSFQALILALHKVGQRRLPITMVGAGLPQLPKLTGEAKSYSERLFVFPVIGRLTAPAARAAIETPLSQAGVPISSEALDHILEFTGSYPYFLQEVGSASWNIATDTIDLPTAQAATTQTRSKLDESFFRVRAARATQLELAYMRAMAELDAGPYRTGDVTATLGYDRPQQTAPTRAKLLSKGLIYTLGYGQMDFTVPLFDDYLHRTVPFRTREQL